MREIEDLAAFDSAIAEQRPRLIVQGVDLRARTSALQWLEGKHVFLGCEMEPPAMFALVARGSVVLPALDSLPFRPFRPALYTAEELYRGLDLAYEQTPDGESYQWYLRAIASGDLLAQVAMALHDQAISDALDELLEGKRVAAIMGGHKMLRGSPEYRDAAILGRTLARAGLVVATGGGPGAMEAANLGAHLSVHADEALDEALAIVREAPDFHDSIGAWAAAGMRVRQRFYTPPDACCSLGIPTWYYGHEPPNVFASHIGKYFSNAIREDGLLHRANAGVAFLRGAAGTTQEIFQDAAQNYYAAPERIAPMVLVDERYWTETLPAWPLLKALAGARGMAAKIALVDTVHDAAKILSGF